MKTTIKALLSIILCIAFAIISSCSTDEPKPVQPETPSPIQPENPTPDKPKDPVLATEIIGSWSMAGTNIEAFTNVSSKSSVEFFTADSLTIKWFDTTNEELPYSIVKGKYTVNDNSLRLEWKTVTTDSLSNAAFATMYLSGECTLNDKEVNYNYSIYDIDGDRLSGPHSAKFTKL